MSFRLFTYYCAVCGAWAAVLGWALSRVVVHDDTESFVQALLDGGCLGLIVIGLSVVDALGNLSPGQTGRMTARVGIAVILGLLGSLIGAALGQALYSAIRLPVVKIVGWTVTGLLIGAALGAAEIVQGMIASGSRARVSRRKLASGVLGGTLGGLLGGGLYLLFGLVLGVVFKKSPGELRSSSAVGYLTLGTCIGLFIGLAQVMLKEAWVKVEEGFRAGRELILSKDETTIGRAEGCDIGLFRDPLVEKLHARIVRQKSWYLLVDAGSPSGTLLNGQPVTEPTGLRSGDLIRLGNSVLRFGERPRRATRLRAPVSVPASADDGTLPW
jgi:MFS family permease